MEFSNIITILIIVAVIAGFILVVSFIKRFKRCPPDKIMVISGRVGKGEDGRPRSSFCMHGGAKFVIPLIQEVHFLDLTPFSITIDLRGALSKQNIRVNVPSTFTIGISTEKGIMQKAAERLLGQPLRQVETLAKEIIFGQLRLVIAQLEIEELNSKRDQFMDMVSKNIETELSKIGLKLINANITDITDESGYLEALGQKDNAKALNDAKRDVAAHNREGNTGVSEEKLQETKAITAKEREQREWVANQKADAEIAEKEAETKKRTEIAKRNVAIEAAEKEAEKEKRMRIAQADTEAIAAEKEAEKNQRMKLAEANAEAVAAEKEAEKNQRMKVAATAAQAIAAENDAKAQIALSEAKRLEIEAQAKARAVAAEKVQNAKALSEAYAAEEKAEAARASRAKAALQADIIVQAEIDKQRLELAAEAEAEAIRRKAKGEADALLAHMEAEAEGIKLQLAKRAEAYAMFVNAAGGNPDAAVRLMMADKAEELVKTQVDAIKGVKIDKVTVWDSMPGDGSSTTSNFIKSLVKSVPPMKDVFDMIGCGLPAIGKDSDDKKDDVKKADNK